MNTKQEGFNAISTVFLIVLLCWNIKLSQDLKTTREVLDSVRVSIETIKPAVKELQNGEYKVIYQMNQIDDRLKDVEYGWYEFVDLMFGEPISK